MGATGRSSATPDPYLSAEESPLPVLQLYICQEEVSAVNHQLNWSKSEVFPLSKGFQSVQKEAIRGVPIIIPLQINQFRF